MQLAAGRVRSTATPSLGVPISAPGTPEPRPRLLPPPAFRAAGCDPRPSARLPPPLSPAPGSHRSAASFRCCRPAPLGVCSSLLLFTTASAPFPRRSVRRAGWGATPRRRRKGGRGDSGARPGRRRSGRKAAAERPCAAEEGEREEEEEEVEEAKLLRPAGSAGPRARREQRGRSGKRGRGASGSGGRFLAARLGPHGAAALPAAGHGPPPRRSAPPVGGARLCPGRLRGRRTRGLRAVPRRWSCSEGPLPHGSGGGRSAGLSVTAPFSERLIGPHPSPPRLREQRVGIAG